MMHKKLTFEQYIHEPASRRFKAFEDDQSIELVFNFLANEASVDAMIQATQIGRPAMEALINDIERLFHQENHLDLLFNMKHRQILGSMIRFIMGFYGYYPGKAKPLEHGEFVRTAIVFHH